MDRLAALWWNRGDNKGGTDEALAAIALLLAVAAPGTAQLSDPLAMTNDPADRAVMAEVASIMGSRTPDIARLDTVLVKLPRPTPPRGMVQTARAHLLGAAQQAGPAVAAVEEALRLLPDDPRPKLIATGIFTFSGSPQRAADLWMQASREAPDFVRLSDRYMMMALIGRLTDMGDRARADRISAALAAERSTAALARTREAIRAQHDGDAAQAVTAISNPNELLTLYVDQHYAPVWPRIADWAGPELAGQAKRYLEELRSDWTAADSFTTANDYARQLSRLEAHGAVVGLFLPVFDRVHPAGTQDGVKEGMEFLAPVVARSLVHPERETEARALLAKVAAAMPANDQGNTLNINGAYLTLATAQLDWPQVITRADAFLARGKALGSGINQSVMIQVQAWRACALWRTGRTAEAQRATAEVLMVQALLPDPAMDLHLCRGDTEAARALVIARVADENTRSWALRFVQPISEKALLPLDRLTQLVGQAVRTAPDVLAAVKQFGRVLPQPVNATLPTGFDPFRAAPRQRPLGPGAI